MYITKPVSAKFCREIKVRCLQHLGVGPVNTIV